MDNSGEASVENGEGAAVQKRPEAGHEVDVARVDKATDSSAVVELAEDIVRGAGEDPRMQMSQLADIPISTSETTALPPDEHMAGIKQKWMEYFRQADEKEVQDVKKTDLSGGLSDVPLGEEANRKLEEELARTEASGDLSSDNTGINLENSDKTGQQGNEYLSRVVGADVSEPAEGALREKIGLPSSSGIEPIVENLTPEVGAGATSEVQPDTENREQVEDPEFKTLLDEAEIEAGYRIEGMIENGQTVSEEDKSRIKEEERVWTIDYFVAKHSDRAEKLADTNPEIKKALEAKKIKETGVDTSKTQISANPEESAVIQADSNADGRVVAENADADAQARQAEGSQQVAGEEPGQTQAESEEARTAREKQSQDLLNQAVKKVLERSKGLKSESAKKLMEAVGKTSEAEKLLKEELKLAGKDVDGLSSDTISNLLAQRLGLNEDTQKAAFKEFYNELKGIQEVLGKNDSKLETEAANKLMENLNSKFAEYIKGEKIKEALFIAFLIAIGATVLTLKMSTSLNMQER